jgi:small subunit ribosomal protein S6
MRPYEVMVIFDVGAEAPAIQAVVDRALEAIRSNEGVPGHVDRWGRRPFAYEVKHRREGYYVVIEFSGTSATVAELDRLLSLADEALRHKVIRLPEKVARRARAAAPAAARGGRESRDTRDTRDTRATEAGAPGEQHASDAPGAG